MTEHQTTHQAQEDARNEQILIWLNGRIVSKAEALVSVYDSGFMLGDGVWEGLRLYNGKWAFADEHFGRHYEAAKAIDLNIGLTQEESLDAQFGRQQGADLHTGRLKIKDVGVVGHQ